MRYKPTGMPTVRMAFLVDIFRACKSANIQIYAANNKHRIPIICSGIKYVCPKLAVTSCGFCKLSIEDNVTYETKKLTRLLKIFGTYPYPTNSNVFLKEPFELNSDETP
jgi:hypothetical protein